MGILWNIKYIKSISQNNNVGDSTLGKYLEYSHNVYLTLRQFMNAFNCEWH